MKNPSISVIMATYNGSNYLNEQIDSILAQTLQPVEIIVCDDNSSDNTIEILRSYADKKLLRYYINEKRLGVIQNFKKAASLATNSHFFALADQDDLWAPDKLMKLATLMMAQTDSFKPAMVFSDASIIDKKGKLLNKSLWSEFNICPDKQTFKTLLIRNIVPGCTMLINSKMKAELLDIPISAYMHDAWITFLAYAFNNYAYVKEPLIQHRNHDSNVLHLNSSEGIKTGWLSKINEYVSGILLNKPLLEAEFIMAEDFYKRYKNFVHGADAEVFKDFLKLKEKNYFQKKMYIRYINKIEHP
jgi:glycosyltransferase involved in cell wall biosynthesis